MRDRVQDMHLNLAIAILAVVMGGLGLWFFQSLAVDVRALVVKIEVLDVRMTTYEKELARLDGKVEALASAVKTSPDPWLYEEMLKLRRELRKLESAALEAKHRAAPTLRDE